MYRYKITTVQDVVRQYIVEAESPGDAMEAWDHQEAEVIHVLEGEEDFNMKDIVQLNKVERQIK